VQVISLVDESKREQRNAEEVTQGRTRKRSVAGNLWFHGVLAARRQVEAKRYSFKTDETGPGRDNDSQKSFRRTAATDGLRLFFM
jgi:hypothetical protein